MLLQHAQHRAALFVGEQVEHAVGVAGRLHRVLDRAGVVQGIHVEGRRALQAELHPTLPLCVEGVHRHGAHEGGEGLVQPDAVPPAHGNQVAEPHVGDFVGDDVRHAHPLGLRRLLRVEEQQHLAEGDATQVFHGPEGEIGNGDEVQLLAGVGDVVIRGKMTQGEGADLQREFRQVPLADGVHDAQRHAIHVHRLGGLERADDKGHEVGRHFHGVVEGHQPPAVARRRLRDDGSVGDGVQVVRHDEGDAENGLEIRLVEARKGAAGVGAFKLRGGDDVLVAVVVVEDGAVKAVQLVVEDALEAQHQAIAAGRQGGPKPEPQAFLVRQ